MESCIFCKIISKEEKAWIIHEDDSHVAFLTPFPNTPGFTVVATKAHENSYVFSLEDKKYIAMLLFAKKIASVLDKSLMTKRTGLIIEGMGVNHAHLKLIPMHGIASDKWEKMDGGTKDFQKNIEVI